MDEQLSYQRGKTSLEIIAYYFLLAVAILTPFFFLPLKVVSLQTSKGLLMTLGVIVSLSILIISFIRSARVTVPKNMLTLSLVLLPLAFLSSALAHGSSALSFVGYSFETGTVVIVSVLSFLALLTAYLFQQKDRAFYAHLGVLLSFGIVALFQVIRLFFGTDVLTFGLFTTSLSSLVGNWNDLAIFFGMTVLMSVITLDMVDLRRLYKTIAYTVLTISLFILVVVNFITAWYVLAAFSALFFVFLVSFDRFLPSRNPVDEQAVSSNQTQRKISWNALAVLAVSILFILSGQVIGEKISNTFDVTSVEVRPGWVATYSVVAGAIKDNVLFGAGPNNFTGAWLNHRPVDVNASYFWGTDFSAGVGLLPTFAATTGLIGLLAILFFLIIYVKMGLKALFNQSEDGFSRYLTTSSFLISSFLWAMVIVYVPSLTNVILAFFFTGLFMAALYREGLMSQVVLAFEHKPKLSFVSVLVLVVLLISNLTLGYVVAKDAVALGYFQKSLLEAQVENGSLDNIEANILRAIKIDKKDIYYRGLSELNLVRVNQVLNQENASPESIRDEFQLYVANSIENAKAATVLSPRNYLNWLSLARIYAALVPEPFQIPGAYEEAQKAYMRAQEENPTSPLIPLQLARLEVAKGDLAKARDYVRDSIEKKSNYAEAHFLMAQIEVTEGNIVKAIESLEKTVILSPNNPGLLFQLGILRYNNQNWNDAGVAFEEALRIVPEYANAQYFLGLSYYKLGMIEQAIAQFDALEKSNPENAEVKLILGNLRDGKDPFTNATPPITNTPEKRSNLPLQENN
jgi:tetratricopeptide (TPR) repeat protein